MSREVRLNGVLVGWSDDFTKKHHVYDNVGNDSVTDYSPEESAGADERLADYQPVINEATLVQKAHVALARNANYLAMPTRTNVDVAAQVVALTKQMNALIHLRLRDLTDISDT